jgi:5-methyltetrahydropteroyltriglutamate--homocysteine methyltransferase
LMSFKGNFLLFESSNPRHQHEWEIFEKLKNKIPENKVLIPGVLDTTSNFVEHSSLVRQRIERFVNIVGKERVIAGTDCGFGTFAGFGNVDPDIAYLKLQSLVEGASQVK